MIEKQVHNIWQERNIFHLQFTTRSGRCRTTQSELQWEWGSPSVKTAVPRPSRLETFYDKDHNDLLWDDCSQLTGSWLPQYAIKHVNTQLRQEELISEFSDNFRTCWNFKYESIWCKRFSFLRYESQYRKCKGIAVSDLLLNKRQRKKPSITVLVRRSINNDPVQ